MSRIMAVVVGVALAALAACSATTTTIGPPVKPPASTVGLAVGPGPQKVYVVQPQPKAGSCHYRASGKYPLPDPACTPGAVSPAVTQANIHSTICTRGYSATIRPPLAVTGVEKRANAKAYGYTGSLATAEYDHLVMLDLGGDPNDPRNLWVEPNDIPGAKSTLNGKDKVESAAHDAVCAGKLQLVAAQVAMASDWVALGRQLGAL